MTYHDMMYHDMTYHDNLMKVLIINITYVSNQNIQFPFPPQKKNYPANTEQSPIHILTESFKFLKVINHYQLQSSQG